MLISDKIDSKIKKVKKDREGHFIMLKGIMYQEDITLINIYVPNQEAPKYVNRLLTELKGEIDQNTHSRGPKLPNYQIWIDLPNRKLVKK